MVRTVFNGNLSPDPSYKAAGRAHQIEEGWVLYWKLGLLDLTADCKNRWSLIFIILKNVCKVWSEPEILKASGTYQVYVYPIKIQIGSLAKWAGQEYYVPVSLEWVIVSVDIM